MDIDLAPFQVWASPDGKCLAFITHVYRHKFSWQKAEHRWVHCQTIKVLGYSPLIDSSEYNVIEEDFRNNYSVYKHCAYYEPTPEEWKKATTKPW